MKSKGKLEGRPNSNGLEGKAGETPERMVGRVGSSEHCSQMQRPLGLGSHKAAGDFKTVLSRNSEVWQTSRC